MCVSQTMFVCVSMNNGRSGQWPHKLWLCERVWHCYVRTRWQSLEERRRLPLLAIKIIGRKFHQKCRKIPLKFWTTKTQKLPMWRLGVPLPIPPTRSYRSLTSAVSPAPNFTSRTAPVHGH